MTGELVPSEQVLEAELVEERALMQRIESAWTGARVVPPVLRSRQALKRAMKDALAWVVRVPFRCGKAVGRGLVIAVRGWRNWVRVGDYRAAAEKSEKLADKFVEIRALTLFRWKVTATVVLVGFLVVTGARLFYGDLVLWTVGGVGAVVLAVAGRAKDGSPGRKTVLAGPRILMWTMDAQVLIDVFRDAKLIGRDETLRLVERPCREGAGWAVTVDLPATRKAADVVRNREELASALAVDEVQLSVERVRGKGGHAGRVALWVADKDPYASPPVRTPLLQVRRWDAWKAVPFGTDARGRQIDLPLVWTSLLIGAIPRQGKTMAERLATAGLVLDPHARLYVADFKSGKDWRAVEQVAHRFMAGDDSEHVLVLLDWLDELVEDVQQRYRRMQHLDDVTCPESKVTPAMSRDRSLGMPITALIVDEVHVALEDRTPVVVQGKRLTAGERVGELLTWLAKKAPAAGVVIVLATQRPDSTTIPSKLRAVLGSRFALRVMDWRDSNIVLGDQMNTRGYDSSRLLPSHKGVGILRPDGETQSGTDVLALTVRTFYMPNDDWRVICERGRALREAEGTLTGQATGRDPLPVRDHAPVAEAGRRSGGRLPEPLVSVARYLGEDLQEREFVPTAELVEALDVEPTMFGKEMGDLGCRPVRQYVHEGEATRRVRGYLTADIRAAIAESA